MLNTLFSGKIDDAEKAKVLMKNYDIEISDTILEEAKRMGALAEEMEIVREEGREEGRKEERARRQKLARGETEPQVGNAGSSASHKPHPGSSPFHAYFFSFFIFKAN